jgi:hypothetical protein
MDGVARCLNSGGNAMRAPKFFGVMQIWAILAIAALMGAT